MLKKQIAIVAMGMWCAAGIGMCAQRAATATAAGSALFFLALTMGVAIAATVIIHEQK